MDETQSDLMSDIVDTDDDGVHLQTAAVYLYFFDGVHEILPIHPVMGSTGAVLGRAQNYVFGRTMNKELLCPTEVCGNETIKIHFRSTCHELSLPHPHQSPSLAEATLDVSVYELCGRPGLLLSWLVEGEIFQVISPHSFSLILNALIIINGLTAGYGVK